MLAVPVRVSFEVAVTVYVKVPTVAVFREPTPAVPVAVLAPFESVHELSPEPPVPSAHENAVGTDCP
jgi:hypothetical protein